jgi:CBS domain-containing protein
MRAMDFMTDEVRTVVPSEPADHAWEVMEHNGIHHVVVAEGRRVVGILSDADLGGPHGESVRAGRTAGELMKTQVTKAGSKTTVREAANLMRGTSSGCLLIVYSGRLVGILTALDLLELLGHGVERPATQTRRVVLKDRGKRPRAQAVAKLANRAKRSPAR